MKKIRATSTIGGYLFVDLSANCFICIRCNKKYREIVSLFKQFLKDISNQKNLKLNHQWIRLELKRILTSEGIATGQEVDDIPPYLIYCKNTIFSSDLDAVRTKEGIDIYNGNKHCCSIIFDTRNWWWLIVVSLSIIVIVVFSPFFFEYLSRFVELPRLVECENETPSLSSVQWVIDTEENDPEDIYSIDTEENDSEDIYSIDTEENDSEDIYSEVQDDFIFMPADTLRHCRCLTNYHYDSEYHDYYYESSVYKDIYVGSFYICNHEVTQKEYVSIMGCMPEQDYIGDSLPITMISVREMIEFCQERSIIDGYRGFYSISNDSVTFLPEGNGYRLPMEEEWLYAARGGVRKNTDFIASNNLKNHAWYGGNSGQRPHNIATKSPNSIGMYDMEGNVTEVVMGVYNRKGNRKWGIGIYDIYCSFMNYIGYYESDYAWGVWPRAIDYDHTFSKRYPKNEERKEWWNQRGFRVVLIQNNDI